MYAVIRAFLLSALVLCSHPLRARVGSTGLDHLDIVFDARTRAMPVAGVYSDDVTSLFVNPSGLGRMTENIQLCFGSGSLPADISLSYLGLAAGTDSIGHYGFIFSYTNYGKMTATLEGVPGEYLGEGEEFTPLDYQLTAGAGLPLSLFTGLEWLDRVYIGGAIKLSGHKSLGYDESGVLLDVGAGYGAKNGRNKLGVSLHNLTSGYLGGSAPLFIRLGWSSIEELFGLGRLHWGIQGEGLLEGSFALGLGFEYTPTFQMFAVRLGYTFDKDLGGLTGLSGGFGVELSKGTFQGTSVDYAIEPFSGLGFRHTISLKTGIRFGMGKKARKKEEEGTETQKEDEQPEDKQPIEQEKAGECLYDQALVEFQTENYQGAIDLLGKGGCLTSDREEVFILLGNSYYSLSNAGKALEHYLKALEINPGNGELRSFVETIQ